MRPKKGKHILDPEFRYTPSSQTDLRKTFARIRRQLAREEPKTNDAEIVNIGDRTRKSK